jgi:DNA topoisomerase-1
LGEASEAAPGSSKSADLKAIQVGETCDNCGGPMTVRQGRRGFFLGCSAYPKCRGTKEPGEATLEKIMAVTSG